MAAEQCTCYNVSLGRTCWLALQGPGRDSAAQTLGQQIRCRSTPAWLTRPGIFAVQCCKPINFAMQVSWQGEHSRQATLGNPRNHILQHPRTPLGPDTSPAGRPLACSGTAALQRWPSSSCRPGSPCCLPVGQICLSCPSGNSAALHTTAICCCQAFYI